jgi:hypothetical protein
MQTTEWPKNLNWVWKHLQKDQWYPTKVGFQPEVGPPKVRRLTSVTYDVWRGEVGLTIEEFNLLAEYARELVHLAVDNDIHRGTTLFADGTPRVLRSQSIGGKPMTYAVEIMLAEMP